MAALTRFDWVVVEPDNVRPHELRALHEARVLVFAYLSVGEVRRAGAKVDPRWVLGRDDDWDTAIVDPAAAGWRKRLLARAAVLASRGYDGLFLDTLDSYAKVLTTAGERATRVEAIASFVGDLHSRHPTLRLFFNRGFDVLESVGSNVAAVAAESVLFGWDPAARQYVSVPESDRQWLVARLLKIRQRLGVPVVAIDYHPSPRGPEAREAARRLEAMGLIPWISTPALDRLGSGASSAEAARLLLLHDGAETHALDQSPIVRLAEPHARALGCEIEHLDVRAGLPHDARAAGYVGIVTWFTDDDLPWALDFPGWLSRQVASGLRVAILGTPGFSLTAQWLDSFGLEEGEASRANVVRIATRDAFIGHETQPRLRARGLPRLRARSSELRVHLALEDASGNRLEPVLTAPWGGMALQPYLVEFGYQGRARWIVDPRAFLRAALAPPAGATKGPSDLCSPRLPNRRTARN